MLFLFCFIAAFCFALVLASVLGTLCLFAIYRFDGGKRSFPDWFHVMHF